MSNLIYYFSGTGNSLQVAQDIALQLGDTEVLPMTKVNTSLEITAERIGLVFPVYFWGLPLAVVKFIEELKISGTPYIFAAATYGVWAGKALEQAEELLKKKGSAINYGLLVHMPDNYIIWYGARSEQVQQRLFAKEKVKVEKAAAVISQKQSKGLEKSPYGVDRLLTKPVYTAQIFNSATMDKKFSADNQCTGCGLCERKCPVNNIQLVDGKPQWQHHCELCLACIQYCPKKAIDYNGKTQNRAQYVNPNVKLPSLVDDK